MTVSGSLISTKMSELKSKHLLGIKDLSEEEIQLIFETADNFKDVLSRPIKKVPSLRDITIANVFFENSAQLKKIHLKSC